jgi:amino acid transporter
MASMPEAALGKAKSETALRRELGLRDLTLFAVTCIVGTRWISSAAHAGPASITLWLLGAVFFVAPLAVAVAALVIKYPGAGGLYLWTRADFGPWHGFLCFWIYWMGIAFWFPSAAMFYMSAAAHVLGPSYAALADNRYVLLAVSLAAIWIALGANLVGLNVGKWIQNLGGAATWVICAVLVAIAALVWMKRGPATPLEIIPTWNWRTVSLWSNIAYAMTGLELAGLMGAEIRDPARTLPRAGWMASGFAVAFYAAATAALLVILRPEKVTELNGLTDAAESAASLLSFGPLVPVVGLLVALTGLGQIGGLGTAVSRLPFAVGVDHLLPEAFGKVHPRWRTPHVSILFLGGVSTVLMIAVQLGDTMYAAYQEMVSLMVIAGFIPFIYIFGSAWKAGKRLSAVSGWAISVIALVCTIVPTTQISNIWLFEAKLAAGTLAVIGSAWLVYRRHAA